MVGSPHAGLWFFDTGHPAPPAVKAGQQPTLVRLHDASTSALPYWQVTVLPDIE